MQDTYYTESITYSCQHSRESGTARQPCPCPKESCWQTWGGYQQAWWTEGLTVQVYTLLQSALESHNNIVLYCLGITQAVCLSAQPSREIEACHRDSMPYDEWLGFFYMHYHTDMVIHGTAFDKPVVRHWLGQVHSTPIEHAHIIPQSTPYIPGKRAGK